MSSGRPMKNVPSERMPAAFCHESDHHSSPSRIWMPSGTPVVIV